MEMKSEQILFVFAAAVVVLIAVGSAVAVFRPQPAAWYQNATQQGTGSQLSQGTGPSYTGEAKACKTSLLGGGENDSYMQTMRFAQNATTMLMKLNSTFEGRDNATGYLTRRATIDVYYNEGGITTTSRMESVMLMDDNYSCIASTSSIIAGNQSFTSDSSCVGMQVIPMICGEDTRYIGSENITTSLGTFDADVYITTQNETVWTNKQFSVPLKSSNQGVESELISYTKG